jgi:hypothetical protein
VTFAILDDPHVDEALDYLAQSSKLATFVGAGVSAEAGLPNWSELIRRLLAAAAARVPAFEESPHARRDWVERVITTELPPAAAGIAENLLQTEFETALRTAIFTPHEPENNGASETVLSPEDFFPGPTAHAIAALRMECIASENHDSKMRIFTTNYDDLIERAFWQRDGVFKKYVQSVTYPDRKSRGGPNYIRVRHLNGLFKSGSHKSQGRLTLTDQSFNMSTDVAAHRDSYVVEKLADKERSCLFLGSSFSDPNIIRYIDKAAERRRMQNPQSKRVGRDHVAVFTHHDEDPEPIRSVREEVTRSRLESRGTKVVYLDHYADVPVFVRELRGRLQGSSHVRRQDHARDVLENLLRSVICVRDAERYNKAQPDLNSRAAEILMEAATELQGKFAGLHLNREPIAMAIWLLDGEGRHITPWITTDRIHLGPDLLQKVCVQPQSRWLAVKSVCAGRLLKEERNDSRSRWRYLLAFPLEIGAGDPDDGMDTVTIGAVSLTSMLPAGKTALSRLGRNGEFLLRQELGGGIAEWLATSATRMGK